MMAASLLSKEHIPQFAMWKSRWASAGVITLASGLVLFEAILRESGDRYFSRLGMVCNLFAAVAWFSYENLSRRTFIADTPDMAELERYFVTLSGLAIVLYGAVLLRTRVLPQWVGWLSIIWGTYWPMRMFIVNHIAPWMPSLIPVLFGILLLLPSHQKTSQSEQMTI
jgi:hypothetical protein